MNKNRYKKQDFDIVIKKKPAVYKKPPVSPVKLPFDVNNSYFDIPIPRYIITSRLGGSVVCFLRLKDKEDRLVEPDLTKTELIITDQSGRISNDFLIEAQYLTESRYIYVITSRAPSLGEYKITFLYDKIAIPEFTTSFAVVRE